MANKENIAVHMYVHPKFKELIFKIQNNRINEGKETIRTKVSLPKLTKILSNLIYSNKKVYDGLVEKEIDGI